jgi:hypothetical protein
MNGTTLALLVGAVIGTRRVIDNEVRSRLQERSKRQHSDLLPDLPCRPRALWRTFPLFAIALSRTRLSVAQPVFSATSYVAVVAISLLLFREPLVFSKLIGICIISIGVVLVAR